VKPPNLSDGGDDWFVAGAAAEVAGEKAADLVLVGRGGVTGGCFVEPFACGHQDAGGAEPALEGEVAPEGVLKWVEGAGLVGGGQAFDRGDVGAVRLAGEQEAGPDGDAVEPDGAGAADTVFAADVRPSQAEIVPEEV
jgi:hypothetical protein